MQSDAKCDDDLITYNNSYAELRGNKFYWMKNCEINKYTNIPKNQVKVATNIKNILDKNSKFKGKIYFENLTNDELGLLLLSLKYNNKTYKHIPRITRFR